MSLIIADGESVELFRQPPLFVLTKTVPTNLIKCNQKFGLQIELKFIFFLDIFVVGDTTEYSSEALRPPFQIQEMLEQIQGGLM